NIWTQVFSPTSLLFFFFYPVLFYLNSEVLMPRFYLQKKYLLYFLVVALLLAGVYLLKPFDHILAHPLRQFEQGPESPHRPSFHRPFPPQRRDGQRIDIVSIVLFFTALSVSSALRIVKQWRLTEQRVAQAEAEKVNAELSSLKAQINPHFLFNTLNNIYTLAVIKSEATPTAIMQLAHIMRYVTDDVRQDYVPLKREVECMGHYIDLQRLRLNEKTTIEFFVTGNVEGKQIAPLILMTFVENVFKYGISSHEPSPVTIRLTAPDNKIEFCCQNRIHKTQEKEERTGVGIENTRKRLAYLYPDKHNLKIDTGNGYFTVQLTLQV
ncbi:MAG: sensor histidine kinase, partial [Flavisolibacter sp.]|nr:sensor histidine kinase [Flavisolibacter sp.]